MDDTTPPIHTPEQIANWIAEVVRAEAERAADGWILSDADIAPKRLSLTIQSVDDTNAILQKKKQQGETVLWDSRTYEVLVREENRFGPPILLRQHGQVRKEDTDLGIVYQLGAPSDEYVVFLLGEVGFAGALRALRAPLSGFRVRRILDEAAEENLSALEFFKQLFPRLLTVRVETTRTRTAAELAQHSAAFLFQLTYNTDVPLVETRSWDDLLRIGRITRSRRSRVADIEPPRRFYVTDLIYHYQMGVAADSPVLAFLSYYHIAEHFFEQIFNDDVVASVRERITQPGFSYRRRRDIEGLIREVTKRWRTRGESMIFSEQEALRLTLQRFVRRDHLVGQLEAYDSGLVQHYAQNAVPFCGGDAVDLRATDDHKVFDALAKRIYKTRNAVVHSKEGDKSRFVPFEHDRLLTREIPLARFVAEDIVVGSSSLLQ